MREFLYTQINSVLLCMFWYNICVVCFLSSRLFSKHKATASPKTYGFFLCFFYSSVFPQLLLLIVEYNTLGTCMEPRTVHTRQYMGQQAVMISP